MGRKRIEIGKKRKIKEPFERVKRTQCENCWHTESDCADCDYKMIYDAADEVLKKFYYKGYQEVCNNRRWKINGAYMNQVNGMNRKRW